MPEADVEIVPRSRTIGGALQHVVNSWGRVLLLTIGFALQFVLVVAGLTFLSEYSAWVISASTVFSAILALVILNSRMPLVYKLAWIIPLLVVPLFGVAFYVLYGARRMPRKTLARWEEIYARGRRANALVSVAEPDPCDASEELQVRRLQTSSGYPLRRDTRTRYFAMGEDMFVELLSDLRSAERYIFVETFILADGRMFEEIFAIMCAKSKQGLDVRLMYDDYGSSMRLPHDLVRRCRKAGISVARVNPFTTLFTLRLNNRDHRKMVVIDGTVAYTGGTNIADEYINRLPRFGVWKDSGIRLEGPGAWGFVVLFIQLWEVTRGHELDYAAYLPIPEQTTTGDGVLLVYDDSPFDDVNNAEATYRNMVVRANHTIDIFTPYLVLNDQMQEAICEAAEAGVRVRIVTPGIPDKWYVFSVTRSFYPVLMEKGVEIYEYTPGFLHAKSMVVDAEFAVIGTINFDYRSFYLHQECAVWMHDTDCVPAMQADVEATIAVSHRVTQAEIDSVSWLRRFGRAILRTFAPMF